MLETVKSVCRDVVFVDFEVRPAVGIEVCGGCDESIHDVISVHSTLHC